MKLTMFRPLSTGDLTCKRLPFPFHFPLPIIPLNPIDGGSLLLWTIMESCLVILSSITIAPYTAQERVKRSRSPPTDDGARQVFEMGQEEWGEAAPSESELLRRSMVRAGLL